MRIGVDLGGTKIEAIVLSDTGEIVHRRRVATPTGSYDKTLRAVVDLVQGIESELEIHGRVGIGTPAELMRGDPFAELALRKVGDLVAEQRRRPPANPAAPVHS